jgi:RNA polymerase sigma factor (sigma-70 family)
MDFGGANRVLKRGILATVYPPGLNINWREYIMCRLALSNLAESDIQSLRRRLSVILKNPSDVDDVIQDAYLRVLEYAESSPKIDNPAAFMHRIARNLAIDQIRWRQRTARVCAASDDSEDIRWQVQNVRSYERQIEEVMEQEEILQSVLAAVAQLPAKCREAYLLSRVEQRTYREISAKVGLSVSMIEKYVLRARRHVAAFVAPMYTAVN